MKSQYSADFEMISVSEKVYESSLSTVEIFLFLKKVHILIYIQGIVKIKKNNQK